MVFCTTVVIGSGIFQFTPAQVYVFVLPAFVYMYLAFITLEIIVELCTLLCYEVICIDIDKEFQSSFKICWPFCSSDVKIGAVNRFQFHRFALNFSFLH